MADLIAAEVKKLTTTRTLYLVLTGVIAMAVISVIDPDYGAATFEKPFHEHTFVFFASLLTRVLILVMGIRAITDEFRYGTIVSSLLVVPRRSRLLAAKGVAVAGIGSMLALIAWAAMTAAASSVALSHGTTLALGSGAWRSLGETVAAGAAWAVIGLGLGAIIRSPIVATVGGAVWLMGVEDAVRGWLGDLAGYLPGQAGLSMAIAPTSRAMLAGTLTIAVYAGLMTLVGARAMRRDVT
jgi:ABC-2 type transport system permease protein